MKLYLNRLLFLAVFVLSSFAVSAQSVKKKAAETEPTTGLLYKISGKNLKNPSYIFGTVHIVCTADMLPMDKINGYLDQTERLVMELDMDSPSEMQALRGGVLIPNGKTLDDVLKPDQLAKIDELTKSTLGLPIESLKSIRPLMLQVMLMSSPKVIGCNPPASYELALMQAAAQKKKPVEGLETDASQLALPDSQPLEKQAKALYETALNPEKSFAEFKKMLETYKTQNSDALFELINKQMQEEDRDLQTRLLDKRNADWTPKIEKMIAEKPTFFAVGAGHLGGKNGVLNLLRAKGYKIQAIKL